MLFHCFYDSRIKRFLLFSLDQSFCLQMMSAEYFISAIPVSHRIYMFHTPADCLGLGAKSIDEYPSPARFVWLKYTVDYKSLDKNAFFVNSSDKRFYIIRSWTTHDLNICVDVSKKNFVIIRTCIRTRK